MAARTKQATHQNERRAWELKTTRMWSDAQIASELGVERSTVTRMLQRVEAGLAAEFTAQAERIKARQTAQLEAIAQQAYQEWERSKRPAENERVVSRGRATGDARMEDAQDEPEDEGLQQLTRERRGRVGDPQLLNQVRGALADIRSIWGLDAAKKTKLSGTVGVMTLDEVLDGLEPSDRAAVCAAISAEIRAGTGVPEPAHPAADP